jgi:CheY-like chemotaxis protein
MDGFELAQRIKDDEGLAGATIMMLTSDGHRGDAARCLDLGISAYLTKPVRQSDLLDAISTVLGRATENAAPVPLVTRHTLREGRRRMTVLVAEDNAVNRIFAVRLLEKRGYTVISATHGQETLTILEGANLHAFDLILMDVQMPGMDGFETTAIIRQKEKLSGNHIPIIAMTANAMQGDREKCLAAGMDGYVSKPIQVTEFFREIGRLLPSHSEATGELAAGSSDDLDDHGQLPAYLEENSDLMGELAQLFIHECPRLMTSIHEALEKRDGSALERAAHQMKGSIGNFGNDAGIQAAARLESSGHGNDFVRAAEAVQLLEAQIKTLIPELEELGQMPGEKPSSQRLDHPIP